MKKLLENLIAIVVGILSTLLWVVLLCNPLWFREDAFRWYYRQGFSYFNPFR